MGGGDADTKSAVRGGDANTESAAGGGDVDLKSAAVIIFVSSMVLFQSPWHWHW